MSEEIDNDSVSYSPFWPLLILVVSLILWFGYQVVTVSLQRNMLNKQFEAAKPTIAAAQNWQARYGAIIKDLNETSARDTNAAPILQAAVQAGIQSGLIHVQQQGTNTTATPAPPAPADSTKP